MTETLNNRKQLSTLPLFILPEYLFSFCFTGVFMFIWIFNRRSKSPNSLSRLLIGYLKNVLSDPGERRRAVYWFLAASQQLPLISVCEITASTN